MIRYRDVAQVLENNGISPPLIKCRKLIAEKILTSRTMEVIFTPEDVNVFDFHALIPELQAKGYIVHNLNCYSKIQDRYCVNNHCINTFALDSGSTSFVLFLRRIEVIEISL